MIDDDPNAVGPLDNVKVASHSCSSRLIIDQVVHLTQAWVSCVSTLAWDADINYAVFITEAQHIGVMIAYIHNMLILSQYVNLLRIIN